MRPTPTRLAAAVLLALTLPACDSATPDVTPDPAPPSPPLLPSSVPAVPTPGVTGSATVAATALCDFLRRKLPDWQSVGGENAARAQLAIDLFSFYQEQGAVPDGRQIDEQARTQCPAVRFEVLRVAGIDDFLIL
jgi:hypothetical protein